MSTRAERLKAKADVPESELSCKGAACQDGQHNYGPAPKAKHIQKRLLADAGIDISKWDSAQVEAGTCWACGDDSIPWDVTRARNPEKIGDVVPLLQTELIRAIYWARRFDPQALRVARNAGPEKTRGKIQKRLQSTVKSTGIFDGRQTSWSGNVLHYAQHATATCCRKCMETWHGVPRDQEVTGEQLAYFQALIEHFLDVRGHEIWGVQP